LFLSSRLTGSKLGGHAKTTTRTNKYDENKKHRAEWFLLSNDYARGRRTADVARHSLGVALGLDGLTVEARLSSPGVWVVITLGCPGVGDDCGPPGSKAEESGRRTRGVIDFEDDGRFDRETMCFFCNVLHTWYIRSQCEAYFKIRVEPSRNDRRCTNIHSCRQGAVDSVKSSRTATLEGGSRSRPARLVEMEESVSRDVQRR
jgi:hypothetical protein